MKITRILLFLGIYLLYSPLSFSQTENKLITGVNYRGVIFHKDIKLTPEDTVTRWTPSDIEIEELEKNLISFISKQKKVNQVGNYPIISKNLDKYIRQYAGYISSKGEKIIYVNCFWYEQNDPFSKGWEKKLIQVFDGGSYYWQIHFNVLKKKFSGYSVNGIA